MAEVARKRTDLLLEYDESVDAAYLSPRRMGVRLDGLPYPDDVARVMRSCAFRILQPARG